MMTIEERDKWLAALRSGEYSQCQEQLHKEGDGYCCLGVKLVAVDGISVPDKGPGDADPSVGDLNQDLYARIRVDLEGTGIDSSSLSRMNDNGETFAAIAKYIEEHWLEQ